MKFGLRGKIPNAGGAGSGTAGAGGGYELCGGKRRGGFGYAILCHAGDSGKAQPGVRPGTILVSVGKGIEKNTSLRMSEVIQSEIQAECPLVVLCGPTHAEEVGRRIPSGIVAASQDREAAEQVQDLFMNSRFRVYTSSDVIGVEISAAMKNVIALCAGISDGVDMATTPGPC